MSDDGRLLMTGLGWAARIGSAGPADLPQTLRCSFPFLVRFKMKMDGHKSKSSLIAPLSLSINCRGDVIGLTLHLIEKYFNPS